MKTKTVKQYRNYVLNAAKASVLAGRGAIKPKEVFCAAQSEGNDGVFYEDEMSRAYVQNDFPKEQVQDL